LVTAFSSGLRLAVEDEAQQIAANVAKLPESLRKSVR